MNLDTRLLTRLAIPGRWIYHDSRPSQLEESGLDPASIARTVRCVLDATPEVEVDIKSPASQRVRT